MVLRLGAGVDPELDRRSLLIIAASLGIGLGVAAQSTLLHHMPKLVQNLFDSAITCGGLTAIVLSLLLPQERSTEAAATALDSSH